MVNVTVTVSPMIAIVGFISLSEIIETLVAAGAVSSNITYDASVTDVVRNPGFPAISV